MAEERRRIGTDAWREDVSATEQAERSATLQMLADDPFLRRVAARSIELMGIWAGAAVLDVGCGSGVFLPALADLTGQSGRVVGLDHAPALLDEARERIRAAGATAIVELVRGDAIALPFPDATFDVVHVERVLMHLPDPDAAIREMRRVTRPGGRVVAVEPDSAGVRVDHPTDPEAYALIAQRDIAQFRNQAIGIELNRRFARAGLVDRSIVPLTSFEGTYDDVMAEGDRIAARELVAEGSMTPDRAQAAIDALIEASDRGEFSWLGTMVIAVGRAPEPAMPG